MVALNAFGSSVASAEQSVTVTSTCTAPTGVPSLLTPNILGTSVTLQWVGVSDAVTGYVVEAGSSPSTSNSLITTTSATSFRGNAAAGTYYVRIRALNACGAGPASNEVTVTVVAPLPLP